ncbi:MAG: hypothetical protein JRI61_05550 [Deltaproteobacteria bacterium]|nr:hypothetical protein [Deltaproteobacteria bacterium]
MEDPETDVKVSACFDIPDYPEAGRSKRRTIIEKLNLPSHMKQGGVP